MFAIHHDGPRMLNYRAPSLFQPHNARQALRDAHNGKIAPLVGLSLLLCSVPHTRWIAPMGWDAVWIEWEHTPCNVETMTTMVHEVMFMSEGRTIPFVRVPGHDHAAIGYALDAGASIVVPQVDTPEQAKHVLSAAKFRAAKGGSRSAPPGRLASGLTDMIPDSKVGDIWDNWNARAAVVIQIESETGIRNLDAILTENPDVDAVWLGTLDARVSMGLPDNGGLGGNEDEWQRLVALYTETCHKHDKPMSGFAVPPLPGWQEKGKLHALSFVDADIYALLRTKEALVAAREELPAQPRGPTIEEAVRQFEAKGLLEKP